MPDKFSKQLTFYKPRKTGDGVASQWNLSSAKDCVFLEMAKQITAKDENGNARFGWEDKIRFKLGVSDLGELSAVIAGIKGGIGPFDTDKNKYRGLFHSNETGNAILYFGKDKQQLKIHLSVKRGQEQVVMQHAISDGEACVLGVLLRRAIEVMYNWN